MKIKDFPPKARSIAESMLHLPDAPSEFTIFDMLAKIIRAENAMIAAQELLEKNIEELAWNITDPSDGWSSKELFNTPLRGEATIMRVANNRD